MVALHHRFFFRNFVCLITYICACCSVQAQDSKLFKVMPSSQTGINFKNIITEDARNNALTYENLYNGGGVAVGDINNDGLEDLYFISNMKYNKLYLNLGNFKFKDISNSAGVKGREGWKSGVSMVDINGDNLLDIYVCYSGKTDPEKRRNQLFINKGNLTFEDKSKEFGLDDPSYSTQAAFFDYDHDGDLDVFLLATNVKVIRELEYEEARKAKHPYAGDKLFRNDNDHFVEVTSEAGILSNALGFGLGVAVCDVNKDGWQDIYVSNDYIEPDYLYINNGDGTFTDRLKESLQHISYFSMGSDIHDINNDTWPDIFTTDMLPEDNRRQKLLYGPENYEQYALMVMKGFHHQNMRNMLHLNNADGTFSEIGQLSGISNTDWSWAPLFADYDNDGWKDLFVTNGYFRDYTNRDFLKYKGDYYFQKAVAGEKPDTLELVSSMSSTPLHNYIYRNDHGVTFTDKSIAWGFEKKGFSNGAAYADLDNDGDLDLVVNNQNDEASVYKNFTREQYADVNYISIKLQGVGKNTAAFGSKVYTYSGGQVQYTEVMPVRGYQSSVSPILHIGLGGVTAVDSIRIQWLDGSVTVLSDIKSNQRLEINQAASVLPKYRATFSNETVFVKTTSPLLYKHVEYGLNDFKRQPLLTTMPSVCGPIMAVADVNGDARIDVYVGGTKENPGKQFIQTPDGVFTESADWNFKEDFYCTDADAIYFDADLDGDQDLYIASGGYLDYSAIDRVLQDRLYINNGKGHFMRTNDALPAIRTSKSCVRSADIDKDGDIDLFIGGRIIPGSYPISPGSYVLLNDGHGKFTDATSTLLEPMKQGGMVTDAAWVDLNDDSFLDLVVVGEFVPVRVFINQQGKQLIEYTTSFFDRTEEGLWNKLCVADVNKDGRQDLIVGNFGQNSQLKASAEEPVSMVYADFDKNGSVDPILSYYIQHTSYPFASRDELLDQIYPMRKRFTTYSTYADAKLTDIFSADELKGAQALKVTELRTVLFLNKGNKFEKHVLPVEAQYAPVFGIEVFDYNNDGNVDILMGGNQSAIRVRLGIMDASYGQLFAGDGNGTFKYIPQIISGLSTTGDIKSLKIIKILNDHYLLVGVNNIGIVAYKHNKK
jgi:hypothetical protein